MWQVIGVPEVLVHERRETDEYLVLACDGVWDVMSNDDVASFVYAYEQKQQRVSLRMRRTSPLGAADVDIVHRVPDRPPHGSSSRT